MATDESLKAALGSQYFLENPQQNISLELGVNSFHIEGVNLYPLLNEIYTRLTDIESQLSIGVAVTAPSITGNPVISGTLEEGYTLTATAASVTGSSSSVSWQWFRGTTPIPNATSNMYTLTSDDVGLANIRVVQTQTNNVDSVTAEATISGNVSASVNPIAPQITTAPVINSSIIGQAISFTAPVTTGAITSIVYELLVNGSIVGDETYVLQETDDSLSVQLRVTVSNSAGSDMVSSVPTVVVYNPPVAAGTLVTQIFSQGITSVYDVSGEFSVVGDIDLSGGTYTVVTSTPGIDVDTDGLMSFADTLAEQTATPVTVRFSNSGGQVESTFQINIVDNEIIPDPSFLSAAAWSSTDPDAEYTVDVNGLTITYRGVDFNQGIVTEPSPLTVKPNTPYDVTIEVGSVTGTGGPRITMIQNGAGNTNLPFITPTTGPGTYTGVWNSVDDELVIRASTTNESTAVNFTRISIKERVAILPTAFADVDWDLIDASTQLILLNTGVLGWETTPVQVDDPLVLNFSNAITAGTGNILLREKGDDGTYTTVETIDVNDATKVTVTGSSISINPTYDKIRMRRYSLQMGAGVINGFPGSSDDDTIQFRTDHGWTAPEVLDHSNYSRVITGQRFNSGSIALDLSNETDVLIIDNDFGYDTGDLDAGGNQRIFEGTGLRIGNCTRIVVARNRFANINGFGAQLRSSVGFGSDSIEFFENEAENITSDFIQIPQRASDGVDNPNCILSYNKTTDIGINTSGAGKHHLYMQGTNALAIGNELRGITNANGISIRTDGLVCLNDIEIDSDRHPGAGAGIKYFSDHRTGDAKALIIAANKISSPGNKLDSAIDLDRTNSSNQVGSDEDWYVNDFFIFENNFGTGLDTNLKVDTDLTSLGFVTVVEYD